MNSDRYLSHFGVELHSEAEGLRQALQERPSVDVAKGILIALRGYGEPEAVAELRSASQRNRLPMTELAIALVYLVCGDGERSGDRFQLDGRTARAAERQWGLLVNVRVPSTNDRLAERRIRA